MALLVQQSRDAPSSRHPAGRVRSRPRRRGGDEEPRQERGRSAPIDARALGRALLEAAIASGLGAQDILARPALLATGRGSHRERRCRCRPPAHQTTCSGKTWPRVSALRRRSNPLPPAVAPPRGPRRTAARSRRTLALRAHRDHCGRGAAAPRNQAHLAPPGRRRRSTNNTPRSRTRCLGKRSLRRERMEPPPSRAGLASSYVGRDGNPPLGRRGILSAILHASWPSSAPAFFWVRSSPSDGAWGGSRGGAARSAQLNAVVMRANDALVHGRWDAPADDNVRDLTDEGLAHWPKNPQLLGIRALAGDGVLHAARAGSENGDGTEALRLARVALDLDPDNGDARRLVADWSREPAPSPGAADSAVPPGNGCRSPWGASFGRQRRHPPPRSAPRSKLRTRGRASGNRSTSSPAFRGRLGSMGPVSDRRSRNRGGNGAAGGR